LAAVLLLCQHHLSGSCQWVHRQHCWQHGMQIMRPGQQQQQEREEQLLLVSTLLRLLPCQHHR
jgi:hypothetical protein